jgi:hypothetical protein
MRVNRRENVSEAGKSRSVEICLPRKSPNAEIFIRDGFMTGLIPTLNPRSTSARQQLVVLLWFTFRCPHPRRASWDRGRE